MRLTRMESDGLSEPGAVATGPLRNLALAADRKHNLPTGNESGRL